MKHMAAEGANKQLCDEVEAWIIEYSIKHNLYAVLDEVAKLHPHVDASLFDRLTTMRLGLAALSRLALSSNIKDIQEALKFVRCLFNIWPDSVAVRHRTKVVFGLRIRIIILAIEKDLPMKQVESLLLEHFQSADSQEENMHSSVFEVSTKGVTAFIDDITSYIVDPTTPGRSKLLDKYSIVSPKNESFRAVIESFVAKYAAQLETHCKFSPPEIASKDTFLEKVLKVANVLNASDKTIKIDAAALLRLLRSVHVPEKGETAQSSKSDTDSLLQLFCTAPER